MPVIEHLLNKLLAPRVMPRFARLYEVVEADVEGAPDLLELVGHVVAVGLGVAAELGGAARHLHGVLVVAHQEVDLETLHAPVARLHVGADLLEGGADVRQAVGIVDRRGDVELFVIANP